MKTSTNLYFTISPRGPDIVNTISPNQLPCIPSTSRDIIYDVIYILETQEKIRCNITPLTTELVCVPLYTEKKRYMDTM